MLNEVKSRSTGKKKLFLFLLLLFVFQFNLSLRAQIYSEAPVTISETGERLSNMIYVKFKPGDLIKIPKDRKDVDGNSISNKFFDIRKTFSDFSKNRQLDLRDIKISKAIPNARDEDTLFTDVNTGEIRKLPNLARVFIIKFPKQVDIETIISELSRHEEVKYAHGPVQLVNCAEYPNDQYYTNGGQWYLNTINAPNAWEITKGSSDIKIALIDKEGVELTHSDLQSKIAGGDNNPAGIIGTHGTNVAGFAGAITNNNIGVASLGWNIKLLTYQPPAIDNDSRTGLAQKIKDAADAGAHVINLSFKTIKTGFTSCSLLRSNGTNSSAFARIYYYYNQSYVLVEEAITYAIGKNAVVIASAGNVPEIYEGGALLPCESVPYPSYPALYEDVIAVSGSQQNNNFVDGWNYGPFIDVNAPGRTDANTGLWSTDLNNSYTNNISGTSFSTPQVSALAALIKSLNSSLTPAQIKTILENSADKVGQYSYSNGRNDYFGYGRINAYAVLKYTLENYGGTLTQTLTIPAGETWNFKPGVTVSFAPGTSLTINGTLNAQGTSSSRITFTRSGTSGTWGGIQFNSGSGGNLQYCTIQNASTGIYCYNSSPTIDHCTIKYCGTGIYCDYYSSPTLTYNLLESNTTAYGLWCYGYSSPTLKRNVIRSNSYSGVNAIYNSNPDLGVWGNGGFNSIYSNPLAVSAYYGCYINALFNWWGGTPTPGLFSSYQSTINYTYYLSFDPNPNPSIVSTPEVEISSIKGFRLSKQADDLNFALDKQKDKKYDEAIPLFLEVFKSNKDALVGKFALIKIEECFTQTGKKDFLDYSKKELRPLIKTSTETFVVLLELETHQLVNAGSNKEAMDNLFLIKDKYNLNEEIDKNTLYRIGVFYSDLFGDKKNAQKYFDELKTKYPKDDLANNIDHWLNATGDKSMNGSYIAVSQTRGDTEATEKTNVSVENYPNPFNPSTKISFTIPQKGNIKLRVFDVLGREITLLADGVYEAGKYEVTFNASNLPSGVYFYNLTTGTGSITKKMLLMK